MARTLNFTKAELMEMLMAPGAADMECSEPENSLFARWLKERFGITIREDDVLRRWDLPYIPFPAVPRIQEGDSSLTG